jgi:ABC-2 type transport system ATP-binding protein
LQDVTAEINQGETVGLIGANGAGKSTLLKVLAGILQPTTGQVHINGRISSLLELGAGFNGELSGRDNVYLNAAILGLPRRGVDRVFDDIVAFSELENFIDTPVKHYSSGMYVRLGFAVAVHADPQILLVDEVLAVGDEHFQQKCLAKIEEFQGEGRTILFVSHSLDLVEQICGRGIVLDHGRLIWDGAAAYATGTLRAILRTDHRPASNPRVPALRFGECQIMKEVDGAPTTRFVGGDPMVVTVDIDVVDPVQAPGGDVRVVVMAPGDFPVWVMHATKDQALPAVRGTWRFRFSIPELPPVKGGYVISVGVEDPETGETFAARRYDTYFEVTSPQLAGMVHVPVRLEREQLA